MVLVHALLLLPAQLCPTAAWPGMPTPDSQQAFGLSRLGSVWTRRGL